jgi:hypothetical protein
LNRCDCSPIDTERTELLERSIAVRCSRGGVGLCLLNVPMRDCIGIEQLLVERRDSGQLSVRVLCLSKG